MKKLSIIFGVIAFMLSTQSCSLKGIDSGSEGVSIDHYLQLRSLEIEKEKIEMIKGKQNVSIIMSSGSGIDAVKTIK